MHVQNMPIIFLFFEVLCVVFVLVEWGYKNEDFASHFSVDQVCGWAAWLVYLDILVGKPIRAVPSL